MPNDLTIKPIQAKRTTDDSPKSREPDLRDAAPTANSIQPYVNPTLRLDAAAGLVVIEFRDTSGKLTSSIPSERQIAAYRSHQTPRAKAENRTAEQAERLTEAREGDARQAEVRRAEAERRDRPPPPAERDRL
jgi:hypothetical protein